MYLVAIAWMYVTLMMAVAEAASPTGTLLGALFTFLLYGLLPLGLVVYVMGAPGRSRAIKAAEREEDEAARTAAAETEAKSEAETEAVPAPTSARSASRLAPDAGSEASAAAERAGVAPVRKEP